MASVAFDAKPTAFNSADGLNQEVSGATSITAASGMSVGGSASTLVGQLTFASGSVGTSPTNVAMTWNSVAMTKEIQQDSSSGSANATSVSCSLQSPATGVKTLAASWTTAMDCYMSCASFTGAQINVAGTTSNTQLTSISVNTTSDGATVANFAVDGSTPTVNQTKIWAEAPLTPGGGGSYAIGGSGTNSHTFTGAGGTRQAISAVQLIALGPIITVQPQSTLVYVSQTATFNITATGTGTLHYQWKQNGSNVGTDSSSYAFNPALTDDRAIITCVVTDDNGSSTSADAQLRVLGGTASLAWYKA